MIRKAFASHAAVFLAAIAWAAALVVGVSSADALPICFHYVPTLSEELRAGDAAVIVRLVDRPPQPPADAAKEPLPCSFEVVEVLKGEEHLARLSQGKRPYRIKIVQSGEHPLGTLFLAFGVTADNPVWNTPIELRSAASLQYVRALPKLANKGLLRATFFLDYLEHQDSLLAIDAYDEFAKFDYSQLAEFKKHLPREKLIEWIGEPRVPTEHRRLYLRMLSHCAVADDLEMLENLIARRDDPMRKALDASIFCYLTLKGPAGMPLVESLFLKNADAEFADTYSAVSALRLVGSDTSAVSHRRLAEGLRHVLARPAIADLVIDDLAKWQDWSAMPRLAELFKTADPKASWVRVPVLNYLRACPLPEAARHVEFLEKLDPEAANRAKFYRRQKPAGPDSA
jgi:hypothetical protein